VDAKLNKEELEEKPRSGNAGTWGKSVQAKVALPKDRSPGMSRRASRLLFHRQSASIEADP